MSSIAWVSVVFGCVVAISVILYSLSAGTGEVNAVHRGRLTGFVSLLAMILLYPVYAVACRLRGVKG
jgi:hypothetical protein